MGEIADMMLDGTMCAGCGEFMHDGEDGPGFPEYCESCLAQGFGEGPEKKAPKAKKGGQHVFCNGQPIAKKLVVRLENIAEHGTEDGPLSCAAGQRMYAGLPWDLATAQHENLARRGFVERRSPRNTEHKDRAVITAAGLEFLRVRKEKNG